MYKYITIFAVSGVILTAGYLLWTLQRVFLGKMDDKYKSLPKINGLEIFTLAPLMIIILFVGVYPMPVINLMRTFS